MMARQLEYLAALPLTIKLRATAEVGPSTHGAKIAKNFSSSRSTASQPDHAAPDHHPGWFPWIAGLSSPLVAVTPLHGHRQKRRIFHKRERDGDPAN